MNLSNSEAESQCISKSLNFLKSPSFSIFTFPPTVSTKEDIEAPTQTFVTASTNNTMDASGTHSTASHCLVLYSKNSSRTWVERESETKALEHLIELCEEDQIAQMQRQSQLYGTKPPEVVQYDAADLLNFIDIKLADLSILRFDPQTKKYEALGRIWIKSRIYELLKSQLPED